MTFFEDRTPEIIKRWNENTYLVEDRGVRYVCKAVTHEELELYKRLLEINNPYIAAIYGTAVVEERLCVVQEYVEGETLEAYLQQHGKLDETRVRMVGVELCEGLRVLHENGIIHRDLTPNNLVVDKNGHVRIIDFGISRLEKEGASTDTEYLGTAGFAAPEQYGFQQTTARSDIYSLGVLMNYMLTLQLPTETMAEGALRPIIEKCTRMDAEDRFASVTELSNALKYGYSVASGTALPEPSNVPGFRKNIWWHKVVAVFYYFIATGTTLAGFFNMDYGVHGRFVTPIIFILLFFGPVFVLFDAGNWLEKFPLSRGSRQLGRLIWKGLALVADLALVVFLVLII